LNSRTVSHQDISYPYRIYDFRRGEVGEAVDHVAHIEAVFVVMLARTGRLVHIPDDPFRGEAAGDMPSEVCLAVVMDGAGVIVSQVELTGGNNPQKGCS